MCGDFKQQTDKITQKKSMTVLRKRNLKKKEKSQERKRISSNRSIKQRYKDQFS